MFDFKNFLYSNQCLFILQTSGQIKDFACPTSTLSHYSHAQLLNTDILGIFAETERSLVSKKIQDSVGSKESIDFKAMLLDEKQNPVPFEWKLLSLSGELCLIGRKIELEKIERSLAHEINNPLSIIQTRSYQIQQLSENDNTSHEKMKAYAENIYSAALKIGLILKSARQ